MNVQKSEEEKDIVKTFMTDPGLKHLAPKKKKFAYLKFEGEIKIPRSMRRACKKNLPFTSAQKRRIKV